MTVGELIDYLSLYMPDRVVVMSTDVEGNDLREIDEVSVSFVVERDNGEPDDDLVVIWPC